MKRHYYIKRIRDTGDGMNYKITDNRNMIRGWAATRKDAELKVRYLRNQDKK